MNQTIILVVIIVLLILLFASAYNSSCYDKNVNNAEHFWEVPSCFDTAMGGIRCSYYNYRPYANYYEPLVPWAYYY